MTGGFVDVAARSSFATCSPLLLTGFVFELRSDSSVLHLSSSLAFSGADAAEFVSSSAIFVFVSPDAAGSFAVVPSSFGPNDCGVPIAVGVSADLVAEVGTNVPTAGNSGLSGDSGRVVSLFIESVEGLLAWLRRSVGGLP